MASFLKRRMSFLGSGSFPLGQEPPFGCSSAERGAGAAMMEQHMNEQMIRFLF